MGEENFDNIDETAENHSLGELLRRLNRVEAPKDFDFRVKARIANADPNEFNRRTGWPVPVYVVSLTVVVIVGSVFLFRAFYPANTAPVPEVAVTNKTAAPQPNNSPAVQPSQQTVFPQVNGSEVAITNPANNSASTGPGNTTPIIKRNPIIDRLRPGGSMDSSLGNTQQILPRGFDVNATRRNLPGPMSNSQIAITDVMKYLGLDTRFEGQALKVTAVRGRSVGDKSGVKAGDIVEAIDDTPITPATKLGGNLTVKGMTLIRGGQKIQVKIGIR
jgi:hypothetical protein